MDPYKELSAPQDHLLLPKAHVHFFAQVVLVVIGVLLLMGGIVLLIVGQVGDASQLLIQTTDEEGAYALLFFLLVGTLLGSGVAALMTWALWKFFEKNRYRFIISFIVSVFGVVAGLLSIVLSDLEKASQYTFYFFALTLGLLSGLLSVFYFFHGLSLHIFGTHKNTESLPS